VRRPLDECRRELAEKNDRLLRALAEATTSAGARKRDREESVRYAAEALVRDFIPSSITSIVRSKPHGRGRDVQYRRRRGADPPGIPEGARKARGDRYGALGQRFDPNQHEAIARVVSLDKEPGTVVGEIAAGYSLRGA